MKRIAIITEGGVALGLGHVQRMLTLAATLREIADVIFITASDETIRERIVRSGFEVTVAAPDYPAALAGHDPLDMVIVDRLHVEESLGAWVRSQTKAKLAIFGNVSEANRHADVVVNAIIGTRFENRRHRHERTGTLYLEGPRYVMLGKPFRDRRNAYVHKDALRHALLMFGGSDQANLTCRAIRHLWDTGAEVGLTACIGPLYPFAEELDRLSSEAGSRVLRVVWNSDAVADLMLESDVVVTSPGNALFEAFSLGVPAVAFFQTAGQAAMFAGFPSCHAQERIENVGHLINDAYWNRERSQSHIDALDIGVGYSDIVSAISENFDCGAGPARTPSESIRA